jgi:hypothetical protein
MPWRLGSKAGRWKIRRIISGEAEDGMAEEAECWRSIENLSR